MALSDDLLIEAVGEVATPVGTTYRLGEDLGHVERRYGVDVLCRAGKIAFIGPPEERRARFPDTTTGEFPTLDGRGRTLVPGFVDAHTHLPWAGDRADELSRRLGGTSYQEIAAEGGGILSTVAATRAASEDELTGNVLDRLDRMLAHGTTTAEAKSGYGLTLEDERKQLRAIARAQADHPIDLVPTLMAAHEFPPEFRDADGPNGREAWVEEIVERIVPAIAEEGLARFCDVFCERGVFEPDQARRVLEAGQRHGLLPRLHADEFVDSGGAHLAAELGAVSADHLIAVPEEAIPKLATAGVAAVVLPGVSFFLRKNTTAPVRRLIEAGVPLALASDYNPGSSHIASLVFTARLGVFTLGLSVDEALAAVTLQPACVLGFGATRGSIEVGKRADLVLLDLPSLLHLAYTPGENPVIATIVDGTVRYEATGGGEPRREIPAS